MTRHTVNGAQFIITHSEPSSSCSPVESLTGSHLGLWVFDIRYAVIALPPPWGNFEDHVPMSGEPDGPLGRTRLALAVRWSDGYLAGPGVGRLYFDPPPDPSAEPKEQDQAMLMDQLDQLLHPGKTTDTALTPLLQQMRQQALLEYVFQGGAGGPLGVFQSVQKWLPSLYAPIRIQATHEHRPDTKVGPSTSKTGSPENEVEQVTITIGRPGALYGQLVLQPRRAANFKPVRLLNADPALRDDICLADDAGSYWCDPESALQTEGGLGTAEMGDLNWYWDATTGAALDRPQAQDPNAGNQPKPGPTPGEPGYQTLSDD